MASTRITRLARLNDKFRKLVEDSTPAARAGVAEAADLIVSEQKRLAPVRTGALRNSIQWNFGEAPEGAKLGSPGKGQAANESRAVITAGDRVAYYAPFVEFGTESAPAQPFFYPAYRANRKRAKAIIQKAVRAAVQRSAR